METGSASGIGGGASITRNNPFLDQAIVIEENGKISVYRNWFQDFTRATIAAELEAGGFAVQSVWNDLVGTPFAEDTEWIGIVARKI